MRPSHNADYAHRVGFALKADRADHSDRCWPDDALGLKREEVAVADALDIIHARDGLPCHLDHAPASNQQPWKGELGWAGWAGP